MSEVAIGCIILFGSLAVMMICRIPISFCLGISSLFAASYLGIPFFMPQQALYYCLVI